MSKININHFGYAPHRSIFNRISVLVNAGKDIPNSDILSEDLQLNDEAKEILKTEKNKPLRDEQLESLIRNLENYRKLRVVSESLQATSEQLQGDQAKNIDNTVEQLLESVSNARSSTELLVSNQKNNKKIIERILTEKSKLVPTGWRRFDDVNGGFPVGGVVILCASSGGGKTAAAIQLAVNQYKAGHSPLIISFEMDYDELWSRLVSNVSKVPFDLIYQKKTSEKQQEKVRKTMRDFCNYGKKNNCNFSIICPDVSMKFSELMYLVKHRPKSILYIDYIGLLAPEKHQKNQWEQLQDITRLAKMAAKQMDIPIVLLAQAADEDRVKYSAGITENANLVLLWRRDEASITDNIIEIKTIKARNQRIINFRMTTQFEIMRIVDEVQKSYVNKIERPAPEYKPDEHFKQDLRQKVEEES